MSKVIITTESELEILIQASVRKVLGEQSNLKQIKLPDRYLNVKEAAEFLNLAPQTLYQFTSTRVIPFFKKGKKLYFSTESLLKWLSEGRQKTKQEFNVEQGGKKK